MLEIEPGEWDLVIAVNLTGAFNVLQAAAPHIVDDGSFTAISSVDSTSPVAGLVPLLRPPRPGSRRWCARPRSSWARAASAATRCCPAWCERL